MGKHDTDQNQYAIKISYLSCRKTGTTCVSFLVARFSPTINAIKSLSPLKRDENLKSKTLVHGSSSTKQTAAQNPLVSLTKESAALTPCRTMTASRKGCDPRLLPVSLLASYKQRDSTGDQLVSGWLVFDSLIIIVLLTRFCVFVLFGNH